MRNGIILMTVLAAMGVMVGLAGCQGSDEGAMYTPPAEKGLSAAAQARLAVVKQLVADKKPADAGKLIAALGDSEPLIRRFAIYGLERIGDTANVKHIIPLASDQDVMVRRAAIVSLGKLQSREAVPALVKALQDPNIHARLRALLALGRIGDPSSQKAIIAAMQDKQMWTELPVWDQVAVAQMPARTFFTDRAVVPVLKGLLAYSTWDHPEFAELADQRREQFSLLISNAAANVLAVKFGDASGEEYLLKGLAADDYMQQSSAYALGVIRSRKAVPGLVKMLDGEWLINKHCAVEALGSIGGTEAVAGLEKLLAPDGDIGLRRAAAAALAKIEGKKRDVDLSDPPAAVVPDIAEAELKLPGGKRPPQFICLGVDDCGNIEGLEAMVDIAETLHENGSKAVFTMWVAPLCGDYTTRDIEKQRFLIQRLFDLGSEVAHHTLHHNPGGHNWSSLPREQQVVEIEGCTQWYRDHIAGITRPFTHKGGGGGSGAAIDREFTQQLLARQKFLYRGGRGGHPNDQTWPPAEAETYRISTGELDGNAPPVHARITRAIRSDYPGQFDFELADGLAMMKANFEYRYNHPRRPIFAVNAYHDWGFKSLDDSTCKSSHRNEAAILKAFLMDVLVKNKDKYPDTYCVTFRQVVEYARSEGDLKHTLAAGNCQDSRNPEKPLID